jgi:Protein of unknown function (DUF2934)
MATQTKSKKASPASAGKTPASRKPARKAAKKSNGGQQSDRLQMIAEAAYYRAEARGFISGDELQDWLDAENEIDRLLGSQS